MVANVWIDTIYLSQNQNYWIMKNKLTLKEEGVLLIVIKAQVWKRDQFKDVFQCFSV